MRNRTEAPREGNGVGRRPTYARSMALLLALCAAGCGGSKPPLPPPYTAASPDSTLLVPEVESYRILVNDELILTVLGYPELSGGLRVLPDGMVTVPGVGPLYILGSTVEDATQKVRDELSKVIRYPQASLSVSNFGERRIYVMGEVALPGDHVYHRGMTIAAAIAEAGGFSNTAKRSSVVLLRRLGSEEAVAFRVDLRGPLKGRDLEKDLPVKPFDIVYVPKTFIASVDLLMDQYFRQLAPPFLLYIDGWNAFHVDDARVRFITPR